MIEHTYNYLLFYNMADLNLLSSLISSILEFFQKAITKNELGAYVPQTGNFAVVAKYLLYFTYRGREKKLNICRFLNKGKGSVLCL